MPAQLFPDRHTKEIPEYESWKAMKKRCTNKDNKDYKYYGGRGIKICDEWKSFKRFYEDMGPKPEGYTLDRIDNNKGYSKENCRWASRDLQSKNRRYKDECLNRHPWTEETTKYTHNGVSKTRRCLVCLKAYLDKRRKK